MKLLLTSVGWEKNPAIGKEFLKLVNKKPSEIRIFLVITPTKYLKRKKYILSFFQRLKGIKIPKENVKFFQLNRKVVAADLRGFDVIFVFGGNTFEYLDRIRKTGLMRLIKNFVKKNGVYVGLSAGSYVVGPTIETASWKHADNNVVGLENLKGLGLVSFLISAHYEKKWKKTIEDSAHKSKHPVVVLTDKQAVLINGDKTKIIGSGKKMVFNTKEKF